MSEIRLQKLDEITIFHCIGRFVYGSEDALWAAFSRLHGLRLAVLDLAGVTAMDAAGLGLLVALQKRAKKNGVDFRLLNLTPWIEDLLKLTNLRSVFVVCSVAEMFGLLCRAWSQTSVSRKTNSRRPLEVLDHAELAPVQGEA